MREVSQWKGQRVVPPVPVHVPEVTPQKRKKRKVKNSPGSGEANSAASSEVKLPFAEVVADVSADDAMGDGHLTPDGIMSSLQQAQRCLTVVFDSTILFSCWGQHYRNFNLLDHSVELHVPNYSALHTSLMEHCRTTYVIYNSPTVTRSTAQETTDTVDAGALAPILTYHSELRTTEHITHPTQTANPIANMTVVQRSILKKRTYDDSTSATAATSFDTTTALQSHGTTSDSSSVKRAKKGVSFDITASMQYKRWRSGRTSHFSVEAALLEVQGQSEPSTAANNNAVANMRVVSATYGASLFPPLPPLLTWLPSSPLPNLPPLPSTNTNTPPSILKKRSYSESVTTNDDTILTDTEPYVTPDQQPPRKCVRFSEEVPAESKERTGVYMSYKRRIAERTARLAAMLQQPTATATTTATSNKRASSGTAYSIAACTGGKLGSRTATATPSTYNSDSSNSNSDSSSSSSSEGTFMELTSTNLGSFWGSSTFRTNNITTNSAADSNQRNRNITWSTRPSHTSSSAATDRGSPQESDTESDLTEVSSQSPPPAWPTYPAGTISTSSSYTRITSSNRNCNTSSNSNTNENTSANNSTNCNDSVQPCSLYEEFLHQEYEFNPFIAADFNSSDAKRVDAQNENVDTSNVAASTTTASSNNTTTTCTVTMGSFITTVPIDSACDEDSPFFEDDPYYTHYASKRAPIAHVTPKSITNTSATATVSPDDAPVERNLWSEDVL